MRLTTFNLPLTPPPTVKSAGQHVEDGIKPPWVQPKTFSMGILMMCHGIYRVDGTPFPFQPWDFLISPPGSRCELEFTGEEAYMYDIMTIVFAQSEEDVYPVPIHSSLGSAGPGWDKLFRRGLNLLHFTKGPLNAVATGILWSIAQTDRPHRKSAYVDEAERLISERLGQTIRIEQLAAELGISQSQLNRLFLVDVNRTPMQYVQEKRATKAMELLTGSVMPIKQVATECGFPDLHTFSRFVRNRLGASPRRIRTRREAIQPFPE